MTHCSSKYPNLSTINPAKIDPTNRPDIQLMLVMATAREYPPLGPNIPGVASSSSSTVSITKVLVAGSQRYFQCSPVASIIPTPLSKHMETPIIVVQVP